MANFATVTGMHGGRPTTRSMLPFLALGIVVAIPLVAPASHLNGGTLWLTLGIFLVACAVQLLSVRRPDPSALDALGSWVCFGGVFLLQFASRGTDYRFGLVAAIPLIWLALFGTRAQLMIASVLTAVSLFVPIAFVQGEVVQTPEAYRALALSLLAVVLGSAIHLVVHELRVREQREKGLAAELNAVLDAASLSAIVSTDREGTVTSFSRGAEELLGYAADEVLGTARPDLFLDPDEVTQVAADIGVAPGLALVSELAHRHEASRVWTYVRKDGVRGTMRMVVTELVADDDVTGYLGVAIDATAEIKARRALDESEARWRTAMNHLPDLTVLVVDAELRVQMTSGAGAMREGLGDAAGEMLVDITSSDNFAVLEPAARGALAGREHTTELRASRSGREHELWVSPLPGRAETPEAMILARDISKELAREREIIATRDRAQRLFDEAPHGVVLLDTDGTIRAANPSFAGLAERSEDDLVGRQFADLGRAGNPGIERHLAALRSAPGGRSTMEWTLLLAEDRIVHVALSSVVLAAQDNVGDQILVNVTDLSERYRLETQMAQMAESDPLTGLVNRRRFSADLEAHLEFGKRYGFRGALLLLDLDHFKEINDLLGHNAGDELIVSVASVLRNSVRETDTVCRLGGDEFAVLLKETDREGAEMVAETVVSQIRQHTVSLDGTPRTITASVGLVMIDERNTAASDLLAAADMTMYDAKDAGRDQWALLDYELFDVPRMGARLAWNTRIERAIENDDFVLHLQPIWDMKLGRVTGAEALLRLSDGPTLVYPGRFLYVAERTGLIKRLDDWVLRRAMPILKQLQGIDPQFHLEVNVSGKSIGDSSLEKTLISMLNRHDVNPAGLVLEITETAAVADIGAARAFAQRVTALGCRFALDDFGAGFGSFYYLKHLIFDYVKIDGEFVSTCHLSPTDRAIVHAIVGIAHGLGKRTIAEFVCDPAILEVIQAEGVDFAQGYHIGRAIELDEFIETFLRPIP